MAYDGKDPEVDGPEFYEQRRTSFGHLAPTYDAVRPEWPAPTIAWLTGDRPAGARVLDLGAGTGKGTRTLVALGHQVTAVDPSQGMLDILRDRVPEATALVGDAAAIPLPDNSFDAVIVLQAWHWFDSLVAGRECARVLAPGGFLGIAWHIRDERVPWVADLSDASGRREDPGADLSGVQAPDVGSDFGPAEPAVFGYEMVTDVDGLVGLASSWSYLDLADDRDDRLAAVRRVAERVAADSGPGDGHGHGHGPIRLPHRTQCYRYVRA